MRRKNIGFLAALLVSTAFAITATPAAALTTVSQTGGLNGTLTITGDGASEFLVLDYGPGMASCPVEWGACNTVHAAVIGADTPHYQAGPGCHMASPLYEDWGVICPDSADIVGDLGAGDDGLRLAWHYAYDTATVHGGPGNDTLEGQSEDYGYPERDIFYGDAGYDELSGYAGDDELHGGDDADGYLLGGAGDDEIYGDGGDDLYMNGQEGNDLIDGGDGDDVFGAVRGYGEPSGDPGSDTIIGGPGFETMSYAAVTSSGVSVTMDGQANDGIPGENDSIGDDIDKVEGTGQDDTLVGGAGPNEFDGSGGNDLIDGGGGNDTLKGGAGNDKVIGGAGQDTLNGDAGFCSLGWGDCPGGADTIAARDGERDALDCGPEADSADADSIDIVPTTGWETCETVALDGVAQGAGTSTGGGGTPSGPDGGGGGTQTLADTTAPTLVLAGARTQRLGRTIAVALAAANEDRWVSATGRVKIASRARQLSLKPIKARLVAKGNRAVLKLAVPTSVKRSIRAALRKHHRVTATVTVRASDAAKNVTTRKRSVALKR